MTLIALLVALLLSSSPAKAEGLDSSVLSKPLDTWFDPKVCKNDPEGYFYISLGKDIFKIPRSAYQQASLSSFSNLHQSKSGEITSSLQKNTGCPEAPMPVLQIFLSAPSGAIDTGIQGNIFILRLDANQRHDTDLTKLRDSGSGTEVNKGLLYFTGKQTLGGVKRDVAYLMAKDPNDLQKSGGPMRARCLEGKEPKVLICSVIDAINKDAAYEAVLPVWPPKLEDIHKLHDQMEAFVETFRVK